MSPRTKKPHAAIGVTLAMLAAPGTARAQELNLATLDQPEIHRVHLRTGFEYAFVASVGYARVVPLLDRWMVLRGDLTFPWARIDASDYRLRVGALAPIVGSRRWKLAGALAPTLGRTKNPAASVTSLGADIGLAGGYYARHWFVAGELGVDAALTTHVAHTDYYREMAYADARSGWYGTPGGNFRGGVQAGASFWRYDLVLRIGQTRDTGGKVPLFPFYGTLALDTRW